MKSFKPFFIVFFISNFIVAQNKKTTTHYYLEDNSIKTIGRIESASFIKLKDKPKKYDSLKNLESNKSVLGIKLANFMVPKIINKLSSLIYKPEKYAKSNTAIFNVLNFPKEKNNNLLTDKILVYRNFSMLPDTNKNNLLLSFSFHESPYGKNLFKVLKFDNYLYNYTNVKLKRKHHKINILIDISISYFNEYGILKSHSLRTIKVENATPKGQKTEVVIIKEKIERYIPTKQQIESITITVNEVNSRKKTWDKWLKFYQDNKGKASDSIINIINPE
ncbi:hypothetical protein [Tenacibaculum sp. nBUS_03]|uniref:hypothetical protein n=1 Tax=Tenacibaculum sp. nBUS_03 TaxID=3395320 RepID=UPI003EB92F0E